MKAKTASLFIDLETLGCFDDAVILSMGLCLLRDTDLARNIDYDFLLNQSEEFKFDVRTQMALGRKTNKSVMDFWRDQGESAKRVLKASPDDQNINQVFGNIEHFLRVRHLQWSDVRIFDRNKFDTSKLAHVWDETLKREGNVPWDYRDVWEIATFLRFNSKEESRYGFIKPENFEHPKFVYHSAMCDAALDAFRFYKAIKGEENVQ